MTGTETAGPSGLREIMEDVNKKVEDMKVEELKAELKKRKMKTTGNKEELVERLRAAKLVEDSLLDVYDDVEEEVNDNDDDGGNNGDNGDNGGGSPLLSSTRKVTNDGDNGGGSQLTRLTKGRNDKKIVKFSFKDVENSVTKFDGKICIKKWVTEVEQLGKLYDWSDTQILVYAKRSLVGVAEKFIKGEGLVGSWKELKDLLVREFEEVRSLAEILKMLEERVMKKGENVYEYYLELKSLAKNMVDDKSLMYYVTKGISDRNKFILYGADNLVEFRKKLRTLESIMEMEKNKWEGKKDSEGWKKMSNPKSGEMKSGEPSKQKQQQGDNNRCFNCGETGHFARECSKAPRERGSCFQCGELGHKIQDCPKKSKQGTGTGVKETALIEPIIPSYEVSVQFSYLNQPIVAMVDCGSPVSFIKTEYFSPKLELMPIPNDFALQGVNRSKVEMLGMSEQEVLVNGEVNIKLQFFIVPSNTMAYPVLLGRNFTDKVRTIIDNTGIRVEQVKNSEQFHSSDFPLEFLNISVVDESESLQLNVSPEVTFSVKERLVSIVKDEYLNADRPIEPRTDLQMKLVVQPDHNPFYFTPRRLSFEEKEAVNEIVDDLLRKKFIQISNSQYASAIVLIKKPTGKYRMAVDYRALNKITLRDNFPIPRIDDHLDNLRGKGVFTKLDLKDAFHHVKLDPESWKFTSFVTFRGQYEYTRMPFGLKNGPSFFMRFIYAAFRELIESRKILIYLDDILIPTETFDENLMILSEVLQITVTNCLDLNLSKCEFLFSGITYLGYFITKEGISPSKENIQAVLDYPVPRNFRELASFLGLMSYFRRFILNYATMAKPLQDVLKRQQREFRIGEYEIDCFEKLKRCLVKEPVLCIYSPTLETQLHCDASADGYGAILVQRQEDTKFHPVAYFSKKTSEQEAKYHSFELEAAAIIYALEKFRIYLQGIHFTIVTDCNSLKLTLEKKDVNQRILRWSLILRNYDYDLEHRSGNRMQHVDALSRVNCVMIIEENSFERNLAIAQEKDEAIKLIRENIEKSEHKWFEMRNGLVYRKLKGRSLFYVPSNMEWQVVRSCHDDLGHFGVDKTYEYLSRVYWFPEAKEKVKLYIENCLKCITYSSNNANRKEGELHCIPKGVEPFQIVHIDHFGPLEKSGHFKYIFEVIDGFTRFVRLYPCKSTDADEVMKHLDDFFRNFSCPKKYLISDRGTAFTSNDLKEFLTKKDIQHVKIATGTPQANGQIERINRVLTPMLAKLSKNGKGWDQVLPEVEYAINNSVNRCTKNTPARLLFGVDQKGRSGSDAVRFAIEELNRIEEIDLEAEREGSRKAAEIANEAAAKYNKSYYDSKHKAPHKYKKGDYVMIRNVEVTPGVNKKGLPKYKGPYVVKEVLDRDRYVITDIDGFQVTQRRYEGVASPQNMKYWIKCEQN